MSLVAGMYWWTRYSGEIMSHRQWIHGNCIVEEISEMLAQDEFRLSKGISNSYEVLEVIPSLWSSRSISDVVSESPSSLDWLEGQRQTANRPRSTRLFLLRKRLIFFASCIQVLRRCSTEFKVSQHCFASFQIQLYLSILWRSLKNGIV